MKAKMIEYNKNYSFKQLNCNKSKLSNFELCNLMKKETSSILLLSEPYWYKKRIPGLPKGYVNLGVPCGRATIVAPTFMNLVLLPNISSPDFTVALLQQGDNKIYFVSAYLDINKAVISEQFSKVLDFLSQGNKSAVLGMDSNAHSVLWGYNESNERGEAIEELIFQYDIKVLNRGSKPTFQSHVGSSIIDITLAMGDVYKKINNWRVSDKDYYSDHFMITFNIEGRAPKPPLVKKTNWFNFEKCLDSDLKDRDYSAWSTETIESEASALLSIINGAIHKSSYYTQFKPPRDKWWSEKLNNLKNEVDKKWRQKKQSKTPNKHNEYIEARNLYKNAIKKAKKECWQLYVDSIDSPEKMAAFSKSVRNACFERVGLLKKPDGSFTKDSQESLGLLLSEHFPGSVPLKGPLKSHQGHCSKNNFVSYDELKNSYITSSKVSAAINEFGSLKAAGPDGLKPIALQILCRNKYGLKRLTMLLKAIIKLGYTPKQWVVSEIIFIPKMGKSDYSQVRSFRPISLLSYFYKTIEKMVLWEIEEKCLVNKPIHKFQFAFKKGSSCDHALSSMVNSIESSILRKGYSLVVLLDISGAFDNARYVDILDSLYQRKVPQNLIKWYRNFLYSRTAYSKTGNKILNVKLNKGLAQGAVLSPRLWNFCFEKFILALNKGPVQVKAFADDAALIVNGCDLDSMIKIMQGALHRAFKWGQNAGLQFVPSKTEAIIFSRKNFKKEPKKLVINGNVIQYSKNVKWLGVNLDSKLYFREHIKQKISKAKSHMMMIKNMIGTYFGPSPKALKWAIQGILIPSISYGSVVWSKVCDEISIRDKLTKLNRFMVLTLMPARRSTPTAALELFTGIKPLDIKIEQLALQSFTRILHKESIKWSAPDNVDKGHLWRGKQMLSKIGIYDCDFDVTNSLNLNKKYKIDFESFKKGQPETGHSFCCYTDGSKMSGQTGYGYAITNGNWVMAQGDGKMSPTNTVFQAEICAIKHCVENIEILDISNDLIIYSDSQAALYALESHKLKQQCVKECADALNSIGTRKNVTLKYIKAHVGHVGNEIADMLAKKGTKNVSKKVVVAPPISWAKQQIENYSVNKWNSRWDSSKPKYRQTRNWYKKYNRKAAEFFISLSRQELGLVVQFLSGHNRLKRHQALLYPHLELDEKCSKCKQKPETSWHLIADCPYFMSRRRDIFHVQDSLKENPEWEPSQIIDFINKIKFDSLNKGGDSSVSSGK